MYNWSVDIRSFGRDKKSAQRWRLEQAINFGLNGEKLDKALLRKHWKHLRLDPARRRYLRFLLWPSKS